ncbi:MAG TPA: hypothetical protein VIM95_03365 [Chitinimonas sp.]
MQALMQDLMSQRIPLGEPAWAGGPMPDHAGFEVIGTEAMLAEAEAEAARLTRLDVLGQQLQARVDKRVANKRPLEQRWLDDLRQYNNRYDEQTLRNIRAAGGSEVFVGITRGKVASFEARMDDLLMPTADEDNYGLQPSPIPTLAEFANKNDVLQVGGQPVTDHDGQPLSQGDAFQRIMADAKQKSEAMERTIRDQLTETRYAEECRQARRYMARLGTAIIRAVEVVNLTEKVWNDLGDGVQDLVVSRKQVPAAYAVDPFDFFPDESALRIEDAEDVFERAYLTRKQLREMAKAVPDIMRPQIRRVLTETPSPSVHADHLSQLRQINGDTAATVSNDNRYTLWRYSGPIRWDDLAACGCGLEGEETDPLEETSATVWFIDGVVIKAALNHDEKARLPYSVAVFEPDPTSLFGFGIPYLCRDSQRLVNATWRMMVDNAGLSVAGQIIYNPHIVEPVYGGPNIEPRKLWRLLDDRVDIQQAFRVVEIPIRIDQLERLHAMAMRQVDEETQIPLIAQGEQAPHITKTAAGMSLLMDSANSILRRAVRAWDDQITTPTIARFIDWNMAYNPDPAIKGDHQIRARGTAALLEKEQAMQRMMQAIQIGASNPEFAGRTHWGDLYRELYRVARLPLTLIKDEASYQQEMQQRAQQQAQAQQGPQAQPQPSPDKQAELQLKGQIAQGAQQLAQQKLALQASGQQLEAALARERLQADLQRAASQERTTLSGHQADLAQTRLQEDAANQRFNAEAQLAMLRGHGI